MKPPLPGRLPREVEHAIGRASNQAVDVGQHEGDCDVGGAIERLGRVSRRREHRDALLVDGPILVLQAVVLVRVVLCCLGTVLHVVHLHTLLLLAEPVDHAIGGEPARGHVLDRLPSR